MAFIYHTLIALMLYYPLPKKTYITSGFMEPRSSRFHAGVDFGTHMQEGIPIISPENGEIYHIHIFNGGYGKAMYMRGISGKIYVFAHLSRFRRDIENYVINKQFKSFEYTQNLYFYNRFLVTKNEIIGYTGSTGLKSPHLHFEVRSSSNNPINPLPFLALYDTIPPEIDSAKLIPLNTKSNIAGLPVPSIIHNNDTVNLQGDFGIILFCKDYIDNKRYSTVPYIIKTISNGKEKTVFIANQFRYSNYHYAAWIFHHKFNEVGIRLYNKLPNLRIYDSKSFISNIFSISASDFTGNTCKFRFFISNKISIPTPILPDSIKLFQNGVIHITTSNKNMRYSGANLIKSIKLKGIYHLFFFPETVNFTTYSDTFYKLSDKQFSIDIGNYHIELQKNSLRENVVMKIICERNRLKFIFSDNPFEKPLEIINKKYRKKMIFYNDKTGKYVGTKKAGIRGNITLATKYDTIPPSVTSVRRVTDTIYVSANDIDSRIDLNSIVAYYNGKRLLPIPLPGGFKLISDKPIPKRGLFLFKCEDIVKNKLLYKKHFNR